jgi:hypothetical protein
MARRHSINRKLNLFIESTALSDRHGTHLLLDWTAREVPARQNWHRCPAAEIDASLTGPRCSCFVPAGLQRTLQGRWQATCTCAGAKAAQRFWKVAAGVPPVRRRARGPDLTEWGAWAAAMAQLWMCKGPQQFRSHGPARLMISRVANLMIIRQDIHQGHICK